jgi:tRNA pseudouridine38-40 synthase
MRIKLTISYDGSSYFGSAIQPNKSTIHSKLDEVFKVLNIDTKLDFSGRTDKNVHAFRQVVSCDIPNRYGDLKRFKDILNNLLPNSIVVRSIYEVDENFHARFSAKKREYRYIFTDVQLSPFNSRYISYYEKIDSIKIKEAIDIFKGIHDFEYFSKKGSQPKSTIREIYDIKFYQYKQLYILQFKANSYLRSQIRMMVDFIMKISSGNLTIDDLKAQLNKKKKISWTLAQPNGLYLSKISYV